MTEDLELIRGSGNVLRKGCTLGGFSYRLVYAR